MKRKTNRGERRKYYAVVSHPAIISKEIFEAVQEERKRRSNVEIIDGKKIRKASKYSSKLTTFIRLFCRFFKSILYIKKMKFIKNNPVRKLVVRRYNFL